MDRITRWLNKRCAELQANRLGAKQITVEEYQAIRRINSRNR